MKKLKINFYILLYCFFASCDKSNSIINDAPFPMEEIIQRDSFGKLISTIHSDDWKLQLANEMDDLGYKTFCTDYSAVKSFTTKNELIQKTNCSKSSKLSISIYPNPVDLNQDVTIKIINPDRIKITRLFTSLVDRSGLELNSSGNKVTYAGGTKNDTIIYHHLKIASSIVVKGAYIYGILETEGDCILYFKGKVNIEK